jgi:hypothetical protein
MPIIKSSDKRIKKLLRRLAGFEHICSGNLRSRSLVCGKKRCRCKGDPPALHGPYYYWSRRSKGRLVQKVLSPGQAEFVRKAIKAYREMQQLLREWEEETAKSIKAMR